MGVIPVSYVSSLRRQGSSLIYPCQVMLHLKPGGNKSLECCGKADLPKRIEEMASTRISELVDRFESHIESYRSGDYKEAQLRNEFIDPLFIELGWDVHNEKGYAEAYKDVIHEDAIKVGGAMKAPDYCFRIGGIRKFFVETKKPAVNIKDDISAAYQLRRYAWSAKLPLSILTDFEEFAIYDCRVKPNKNDSASTARTRILRYPDYIDKWEELTSIFSKDAILKGSFDKYVETKKRMRGTAEVDGAFLKEIEEWRENLARNIALRNSGLGVRDLNYAVQKTVDRIIFLRICEDRGIETYGQLRSLMNGTNVYKRLCAIYRNADDKYNSGLFYFDKEKDISEPPDGLTLGLQIDDGTLKQIIRSIYYPDSPYEFSVLPADILGHVYEQFLGKVIRLTLGHHAKVEEKPEVRKAGGVYYTPIYIVDYIVKNTVGKLLEKKTPSQAAKLTILDPACGSGSFLLGAYQYVLDWHLGQYATNDPEKWAKGRKPAIYRDQHGEWRLTTTERKRILLNNIYGVDIDPQAVEVTKLSLLLKVLEGESEETLGRQQKWFKERALPNLGDNIKCGNSLIGPDFYEGKQTSIFDEEEVYRINAFDWEKEFPDIFSSRRVGTKDAKKKGDLSASGGFDAVIGNPPYDVMEKERGKSSWPHAALIEYIKKTGKHRDAKGGKLNLYRFFLVLSLHLLNNKGYLGFIIPLSILGDISCSRTRRFLIFSTDYLIADCFPQKDNPERRVFRNAKLSTMVITSKKYLAQSEKSGHMDVRVYPWNSFEEEHKRSNIQFRYLSLIDPNMPIPLADSKEWNLLVKIYCHPKICRLGDIEDFEVNRGEINQTIYRQYISENQKLVRFLKGVEVGRYHIKEKLSQSHKEWFDECSYLKDNEPKSVVGFKRIATQRITGVDERLRIVATSIEPITYFADSTNSIIIKKVKSPYRLEYILGLLNSRLFQWRFRLTSTNNNVGTNELESMPIRTIDFRNKDEKKICDKMISLTARMLELNKKLAAAKTEHEKTVLQRQIKATDHQIDQLVYELYGLTEEEIKIVEEGGTQEKAGSR
jgi:Alw26I/Eco31I/Esp3I family type II restriction m6 adenine DNA methyltransferase